MNTQARWQKRGFSFLEIMVVLVVFGLLATLAAPRFFAAFEKENVVEFRKLTQMFNLLRNESILRNTRYYVVFDPEQQSYHVEEQKKTDEERSKPSASEEPNCNASIAPRIEKQLQQIYCFPPDFQLENIALTQNLTSTEYQLLATRPKDPIAIRFDGSGFVTPFTLLFLFNEEIWMIRTKNVMGHLEMKLLDEEE